MSTDLESLENLEKPTDSTSEGRIFADLCLWLSKPLQATNGATHQNHLYNFKVDVLGTLYTKWQDDWTTWDWTTDNLPHPV